MTEFILIRHGETDWNRELRFQGQVDVPLNATGHAQARRVAERLAAEPLRHLVSSDLLRARQTAEPVGAHPLQPVALVPELAAALREQSFGVVDGLRVADIKAQHADAWAQWIRFEADYAFAGGESTRVFHARIMAALRGLAQRHPDQTVAVVTHGGVLDMVYRTALGLPLAGPRQSEIPNAGLNHVRVRGEIVEIVSWADTRHLADLPPQPVYDQRKLARQQPAPTPGSA